MLDFFSMSWVLVLQIRPIKTLYLLHAVFWLDDYRVAKSNSYSVSWPWGLYCWIPFLSHYLVSSKADTLSRTISTSVWALAVTDISLFFNTFEVFQMTTIYITKYINDNRIFALKKTWYYRILYISFCIYNIIWFYFPNKGNVSVA